MSRTRVVCLVVCWALFGTLALPACVRAEETPISLGPGAMTFAEIARRLSTPGRKVQCVSSLKDCAALVCLKARTWAQTRELLRAGLDVEIEPDPDTVASKSDRPYKSRREESWILRRDPVALNRERRCMTQFVDCLLQLMQSRAHDTLKGFSLNQNPDFVSSRELFDDMNRENMAILNNPDRTVEDMKRRDELMAGMGALKAADPSNWVLAHLLSYDLDAAVIRDAVSSGGSVQSVPLALFPRDVLVGLYAQHSGYRKDRAWRDIVRQTTLPADFEIWGGLCFDPVHLVLQFKGGIGGGGEVYRLRQTVSAATYYTPESIYKPSGREDLPWAGLGEAANRWLDKERRDTRTFLSSAEAQKPFPMNGRRPVSSVSQVVEQWSRALDTEVVMELLPTREPLFQIGSDLGQKSGVENPASGGKCRLSALFSDQDAWAFTTQDNVLLVRDVFAFVDRTHRFPMDAVLALERSLDRNATPKAEDMLAYARSVAPGRSASWDWVGMYRGIPNSTLTRLPPLLHLLSRLPGKELEKDLTALIQTARHRSNEASSQNAALILKPLQMRRLAARDWENLLSEYRALPRNFPNWTWNRNALPVLRLCDLGCDLAPGENESGSTINLTLQYPDPAATWAATVMSFTRSAWANLPDQP